jgi:hypothetical protein
MFVRYFLLIFFLKIIVNKIEKAILHQVNKQKFMII